MPLYHISHISGITLFEPRQAPERSGLDELVVWGIDRDHLSNYLLPRDCPRVTFQAGAETTPEDVKRFLGPAGPRRVIAVESAWIDRILSEEIILYELDPSTFTLHDPSAGYWLSRESVAPISEQKIPNILAALLEEDGIELRIMKSLWELREAVINSSIDFSIIRMRNATPTSNGYEAWFPL